MTRKQRRLTVIFGGLAVLGVALGLVLNALNDSVVFFRSPTDVAEQASPPGKRFRIGGLVEKGSVVRGQDASVSFAVTDTKTSVKVSYQGLLPDLFREGQGVVAEGKLSTDGVFLADTVLAKHDETYMPPEVAEALKKQGVWRQTGGEEAKAPRPAKAPQSPQ